MHRCLRLLLVPALVLGALVVASPAAATSRTLVVATTGSDTATGSAAHPLATAAEAVRRLGHDGGTIALRGGTYHQRVVLRGALGITVRPYRHERVVLSGAGLTPGPGRTAMVEIEDARDVVVRDLEITGYRTRSTEAVPVGILVQGRSRDVRIVGNRVHHLGNDTSTAGDYSINAHGIAVYGDDPAHPITGLRIRGNRLDHLRLGASETVVVNGNVQHWRIERNRIHDVNNIGIDAIGFEETLPGRLRYTEANRARDGVIAFNTVERVRSRGNPVYKEDEGWCDCADGVYVDGGTRIRIHGNRIADSDIGIEVAAENARGDASRVRVTRNRITGSLFTGIATGGYCDGDEDCGGERTGASFGNVFAHNVLRGNNRKDDGSPEVLVQFFARDNRFVGNRITATNRDHVVYGTVERSRSGAGDVSDRNVFRAVGARPSEAEFGWRGRTYRGFDAYRRATGQDARSVFR